MSIKYQKPIVGGFISQSNNKLIFNDLKNESCLCVIDVNGKKLRTISDDVDIFCVKDENIYFTNKIGSSITRIKVDGSEKDAIYFHDYSLPNEYECKNSDSFIHDISCMAIVEDSIYFSELIGERLIKINIDGTNEKIIRHDILHDMNIVGNNIFFIDENDRKIHKIVNFHQTINSTLVKEEVVAPYSNIYSLYAVDNHVFFTNSDIGSSLFSMRLEDNCIQTIIEDPVTQYVVEDNYIYYINSLDNNTMYRKCLHENQIKRISSICHVIKFRIIGKWIYFYNNNYDLFRVLEDGTLEERII